MMFPPSYDHGVNVSYKHYGNISIKFFYERNGSFIQFSEFSNAKSLKHKLGQFKDPLC